MDTDGQTFESRKLKGMRGVVARKMTQSLQQSAQLTYHAFANGERLLNVRAELKPQAPHVGIEDLVIWCLGQLITKHKAHNGIVEDDVVKIFPSLDLSVAINTPNGLVTPIIRNASALTVEKIAELRRDLVARAMDSALKVSDMTGGTFTLSNLGHSRVELFTPILNLPQIALLGLGCLSGTGGEKRIGLSLTVDHRVVDGADSAAFLTDIAAAIETIDLTNGHLSVTSLTDHVGS